MRARDIVVGVEYYYKKVYPGTTRIPRRGRHMGHPGSRPFVAKQKAIALAVDDGYVSMREKYIARVDSRNKVVDLADQCRMEAGNKRKKKLHNAERTRIIRVKTRDVIGEVFVDALPVSEAEAVHVGEASKDRPQVDEKVRVETPAEKEV